MPAGAVEETEEAKRIKKAQATKPHLAAMINLDDFEVICSTLTSNNER